MKNIRIGEVLLKDGYITEEQLAKALSYQQEQTDRIRLGQALIDLGMISEKEMLHALGQRLDVEVIDIADQVVDLEAVGKIPQKIALEYDILPIRMENNDLYVAVNDPLNFYGLEDVRQLTGMHLILYLAEKIPLRNALEYYYSEVSAKQAATIANESSEHDEDIDAIQEINELDIVNENDAPIIKLLNTLVLRAYNTNASDIHIEPFEKETLVRMRIDGSIVDFLTLKRGLHNPLVARIKIMGGMDIAEKRIPQDGHMKMRFEEDDINIRTSVIPTVYGEKVVLRLLSNRAKIDHKGNYGMKDEDYQAFDPLLQSPNGIIYITGPTGSGKSTTLYMVLEKLSKRAANISTIEDPVEKNLLRVNQMQVNNTAGLTFETGLRALLRQDPDIIMVGETRDNETASISVRAAITGHLVLSTLHTNSAASSVIRLMDMGLEPYLIANSVVGFVAQRLVRKVCPECGREVPTTAADRELLGDDIQSVMEPVGCEKCNHTGYQNRIAIHEILPIDANLRKMIANRVTVEEIETYARQHLGMHTLKESAISLAKDKITTMEEVLKIAYYV